MRPLHSYVKQMQSDLSYSYCTKKDWYHYISMAEKLTESYLQNINVFSAFTWFESSYFSRISKMSYLVFLQSSVGTWLSINYYDQEFTYSWKVLRLCLK